MIKSFSGLKIKGVDVQGHLIMQQMIEVLCSLVLSFVSTMGALMLSALSADGCQTGRKVWYAEIAAWGRSEVDSLRTLEPLDLCRLT